jgi:hypothetical protein
MRRTTGVGEELAVKLRSFDQPSAMTVELAAPAHVYDARTGKYHGLVREFPDRFDPWSAKVYALLPYRVTGLAARPAGPARAGASLRLELKLETDPPGAAGRHVLRCEVFDPRGQWRSYYSKNVVTEGGRGELLVPLAEGDRPGAWRLELRDAVSGRKATVRLRVAAGKR